MDLIREFDTVLSLDIQSFEDFREKFLIEFKNATENNKLPHRRSEMRMLNTLNKKELDVGLHYALTLMKNMKVLGLILTNEYFKPHTTGYDFNLYDSIYKSLNKIGIKMNLVDQADSLNKDNKGKVALIEMIDGKPHIEIDFSKEVKEMDYQIIHEVAAALTMYFYGSMYGILDKSIEDIKKHPTIKRIYTLVIPILELFLQVEGISKLLNPVANILVAEGRAAQSQMLFKVNDEDLTLPTNISA